METVIVSMTLAGSLATAWALQRVALEALFRAMQPPKRG